MLPVKLTTDNDKKELIRHFKELSKEDRRLRFGFTISDKGIVDYINNTYNQPSHRWYGISSYSGKTRCIASVHIALDGRIAELGCTVEEKHRGLGLGSVLFRRAATWAKSKGVDTIYMQCLSENEAIQSIARKNGMVIGTIEANEKEATIKVKRSINDIYYDALLDTVSIYDASIRKLFRG